MEFATQGPQPVEEVCEDDIVYALDPSTRLVKRKPITAVETRTYRGPVIEKQLPPLVWNLSSEQRQILLDAPMAGDGTERGTYYTASDLLAADVLALGVTLGIKPRYTK